MTEKQSYDAMSETLHSASRNAQVGTHWHHGKTGGEYRVCGHSLRETDLEPLVHYHPAFHYDVVFSRPLTEFLDGRFEKVSSIVAGLS